MLYIYMLYVLYFFMDVDIFLRGKQLVEIINYSAIFRAIMHFFAPVCIHLASRERIGFPDICTA